MAVRKSKFAIFNAVLREGENKRGTVKNSPDWKRAIREALICVFLGSCLLACAVIAVTYLWYHTG